MQYVMLIYESEAAFDSRDRDAADAYITSWQAYFGTLVKAGVYVGGEPLLRPATAATVRATDGRPRVQDGPYADTKEQLGGFIVIDVPSQEAALEWAARCPAAAVGAVEVRAPSPHFKSRFVPPGEGSVA